MQIADLEALSNVAMRVDRNPIGLAGRFLGLSASEQRAGVPGYALVGIGLGIGVLCGLALARSKMLRRVMGEE